MKMKIFLGGILMTLLIISSATAGYFYHSYQSLKTEMKQSPASIKTTHTVDKKESKATHGNLENLTDQLEKLQKQMEASQKKLSASALAIPTLEIPDVQSVTADELSDDSITPTSLPRLSIKPAVLDLGTIRQADGVVKTHFTLNNTGDSDLIIYSTFSSCGCTTATIKNQTIAPHQSLELPVQYDPNYFEGFVGQGKIEKQVMVLSNDPTKPFSKVLLKAEVIP